MIFKLFAKHPAFVLAFIISSLLAAICLIIYQIRRDHKYRNARPESEVAKWLVSRRADKISHRVKQK